MDKRAAGEPAEGEAMTEAKQQEAGRARFLLLPPLSAAAASSHPGRYRHPWLPGSHGARLP